MSQSRTHEAKSAPTDNSSFATGPKLWFPGMVTLAISIVQDRDIARLKTRSNLNFSFLLFAFLALIFDTRSLMVQFYGLERKALKSLISALNESRFSLAQKKPSA